MIQYNIKKLIAYFKFIYNSVKGNNQFDYVNGKLPIWDDF